MNRARSWIGLGCFCFLLAGCGDDSGGAGSGGAGGSGGASGAGGSGGTAGSGGAGGAAGTGGTGGLGGSGGSGGVGGTGGSGGTGGVGVPLTDLGTGTYLGLSGGLYPDGANTVPAAHATLGAARARAIRPLAPDGTPSASGHTVLLSIGMSNTTMEYCAATGINTTCPCTCDAFSFMGQAAADPSVNQTALVLVDGAMGGQAADSWTDPTAPDYDRVRDNRLAPLGLSEQQVQAVWLKQADAGPSMALPSPTADAYTLEGRLGSIVRALVLRYPHLQQVFLSSRIYAGYATTTLNPEPYAYESGFAVKWLVEAQIRQEGGGGVDPIAGDLGPAVAPWLAWGPYLWADGMNPRSDGLIWVPADFLADGTHPSVPSGRQKVGTMLLQFFKGSAQTACWFTTTAGACP